MRSHKVRALRSKTKTSESRLLVLLSELSLAVLSLLCKPTQSEALELLSIFTEDKLRDKCITVGNVSKVSAKHLKYKNTCSLICPYPKTTILE